MDIRDIDWAFVNLECRPDRRQHAEAEFARHGMEARRVEGQLITKENFEPGHQDKQMYDRTPGAIGCWNGQVAILKSSPPDKITGVCEDDVCFCDDIMERIDYLGYYVPEDWDVIWLGATIHINPPVWHKDTIGRDAERVSHRIIRTYGLWGTYAWLVNPESRQKILGMLDVHRYHSDGIDDCFIKHIEPHIKSYAMLPGCAWQMDSQSNIGRGVTEFSLFKRNLGNYCWANRMEDFDVDSFDFGEAGYR